MAKTIPGTKTIKTHLDNMAAAAEQKPIMDYKKEAPTVFNTDMEGFVVKEMVVSPYDFLLKMLQNLGMNQSGMIKPDGTGAKLYRPYIYGGYCRDIIAGESNINDIDLCVHPMLARTINNYLEKSMFVVAKKVSGDANKLDSTLTYEYESYVLRTPGGVQFKMDITLSTTIEGQTPDIDFSVNNLVMFFDGTMGVRGVLPNTTPQKTMAICIKDIYERRLRPLYKTPSRAAHRSSMGQLMRQIAYDEFVMLHTQKFLFRYDKMCAKGYNLLPQETIQEYIPVGYKSPTIPFDSSTACDEPMCTICQGRFKSSRQSQTRRLAVKGKCGCVFHNTCILVWNHGPRSAGKNCPNCRQTFEIMYE